MNRILCSTGALIGRPNGRDITLLGNYKDKLDCDGFEFLMYDTWYDKLDSIKRFMSKFDKKVPVFHVEKKVGELISRNEEGDTERAVELFKINCSLARDFGAEKLVLHLWNGKYSDKSISHNIECYKYLREISDSLGLMLTVENVVCGYADPMSHLNKLATVYPDIRFTFDTKMAAFHCQLDKLYDDDNTKLFRNISHFHINDYKGGYKDWNNLKTLHVGDGQIDFYTLFTFLKNKRYSGDYTVEATSFDQNGVIDHAALNRSFRRIRDLLN